MFNNHFDNPVHYPSNHFLPEEDTSEYYFDKSKYSSCCGASVDTDLMICSDCHDHCGILSDCEECEGEGKLEDGTICPKCKGDGIIEES